MLLAATAMAASGARRVAGNPAPAAKAPAPKPAERMSAEQALRAAFGQGGSARSGRFDLRLTATGSGGQGGLDDGSLQATGRFQSQGKTATPRFDIDIQVKEGRRTVEGGAVSLGDRGFLTRGATAYPVPQPLWGQLAGVRGRIASFARGPEPGRLLGVDTRKWLSKPRLQGNERLAGVDTAHVTASVDVPRMLRDFGQLARSSAAGARLPLDRGIERQIARSVKSADLDLYVGTSDRITRRMTLALKLADGRGSGRIRLSYTLSDVNRPQQIAAPRNVSTSAPATAGREAIALGSTALGAGIVAIDPPPGMARARRAGFRVTGASPSGAPASAPPAGRIPAGVPRPVGRAIARGRTVVLFFYQRGGGDDAATADAVGAVRRSGKAAVFTDSIRRVGRYEPLLKGLGVSQAPAVVIVGRDRRARLVQGYVDAESLAQEVADTRR